MEGTNIRARIVATAGERFFAMGFSKVTMDELCGEMGISKKTMYQQFASKDALLDAIIEWMIIRVGGRLNEILGSGEDFAGKLYALWKLVGDILSKFSRQMQDDLRRFRPDLWQKIDETRRNKILVHFRSLIDEGVKLGFLREDVNREILVYVYLGAIQAVINPEVLVRHSFSADEAFRTVLQVILDGILSDDAREDFRRRIFNQSGVRTL